MSGRAAKVTSASTRWTGWGLTWYGCTECQVCQGGGPTAQVVATCSLTVCVDGTVAGAREGALAPASQSEVAVLLAKVTAVAEAAGLR